MDLDYGSIAAKYAQYRKTLKQTQDYREAWQNDVRPMVEKTLNDIIKATNIPATVEHKENMENLEMIVFNMGTEKSGICELVPESEIRRPLIRSNGAIIYQQIFNSKILIMIAFPYIEGYGDPKPHKNIEILRPEELTPSFILRHVETLLDEINDWEDYDDDEPVKATIGFNNSIITDTNA